MTTILVLTVAPAIIILFYLYKRDKQKPEPSHMVIFTFLAGLGSIAITFILLYTVPFLSTSQAMNGWNDVLFVAFIQAGATEELSKLIMFLLVVWFSKHFDEVMDGIIYMTCISLGFAAFENFLYGLEGDYVLIFMRAFTAIPCHTIVGIVMGYFLGRAKIHKNMALTLVGLILAILIHGLYDTFVFGSSILPEDYGYMILGILGLLSGAGILCFRIIKKALAEDRALGIS